MGLILLFIAINEKPNKLASLVLRRNYIVGCMKLSNGGSVNLPSQKIHAQEQFLTFHTIMFCFSSKL